MKWCLVYNYSVAFWKRCATAKTACEYFAMQKQWNLLCTVEACMLSDLAKRKYRLKSARSIEIYADVTVALKKTITFL